MRQGLREDDSSGAAAPSPADRSACPECWYDLSSTAHFWFVWRFQAFLGLLADLEFDTASGARVLDIGCGSGLLRDQLESRTAWSIDGVDLNGTALAMARAGRGRFRAYDILDEQEDLVEAYDVVLLFDVLEHIPDTGPFVRAAVRHLRPGGAMFVNVPAGKSFFSNYDRAAGPLRRYDPESLAREVAPFGMDVREVRYWGLLLTLTLVLRKAFVRGDISETEVIERGFVPPGRIANRALRLAGSLETSLVHRPRLGSSLLMAAVKRARRDT
ncbi:MAG: class I SAM-dependent methyltransferase [Planctomycetota bacterium]|jgi:SAM-dependent methyltransferase